MSAVCVSEPLVPVTCRVKAPVDALELAAMVMVDDAVLPAGGVTGLAILKVTPVGAAPSQEGVSVTAELNPLTEVTVIKESALEPWTTETPMGAAAIKKSGVATAITVTERLAECDNGPLMPLTDTG